MLLWDTGSIVNSTLISRQSIVLKSNLCYTANVDCWSKIFNFFCSRGAIQWLALHSICGKMFCMCVYDIFRLFVLNSVYLQVRMKWMSNQSLELLINHQLWNNNDIKGHVMQGSPTSRLIPVHGSIGTRIDLNLISDNAKTNVGKTLGKLVRLQLYRNQALKTMMPLLTFYDEINIKRLY